jgi:hypothetical protein
MKKVLAAALLCAVSSFAAWDKFPVLGYGKGEAKAGFDSGRQGNDEKWGGAWLGIRYSPLENLEIMSTKAYGEDDNHVFGVRYQIIPVLAAGVDVGVPIPGTNWSITPNVQFSMEMGALSIGSNLGLTIFTEEPNEYAQGMKLDAGIEVDYTIGKSTLWVGFDIGMGLSNSKLAGTEIKEDADKRTEYLNNGYSYRGLELMPAFGYIASVSDNLDLSTWVGLGIGASGDKDKDDKLGYGDKMKTTIGVDFSVKF